MLIGEMAISSQFQLFRFFAESPTPHLCQLFWIVWAGYQRLKHATPGHSQCLTRYGAEFKVGVFSDLLHAIGEGRHRLPDFGSWAGPVAQAPNRRRR